jgi:Fe-S-cluster-containing dehydrogenase component
MVTGMDRFEILVKVLRSVGWDRHLSRRAFLKGTIGTIASLTALDALDVHGKAPPFVILENAEGILIGDPTRCVACGRCELACTEFNDGKAAPSVARIKVSRNMHFGAQGAFAGQRAEGAWGNGLVAQDTCKQCPHPVPCANACPEGAIVMQPATGARVVDMVKCNGCRLCLSACPWDMISFDAETGTATKCFLCNGSPKCVQACPSAALRYVAWRDLTRTTPPRKKAMGFVPPEKAETCLECHTEF